MNDISWADTAGMAAVDLATLPNRLVADDLRRQRAALLAGADAYLAEGRSEGYGLPYAAAHGLPWGSNGAVLDHALVLGVAYDLSGRRRYRDGVVDALDYVLGRNALDRSYVTGYGARSTHHPHHRFWARQFDPKAPTPPPGVLSGGPNSEAMTDPVSRPLKGDVPAPGLLARRRARLHLQRGGDQLERAPVLDRRLPRLDCAGPGAQPHVLSRGSQPAGPRGRLTPAPFGAYA